MRSTLSIALLFLGCVWSLERYAIIKVVKLLDLIQSYYLLDAQFVRLPLIGKYYIHDGKGSLIDHFLGYLVYGSHVVTTVIPCLAEVLFGSSSLTFDERLTISGFYLPYLIIPLMILIDSYRRVSAILSTKSSLKQE